MSNEEALNNMKAIIEYRSCINKSSIALRKLSTYDDDSFDLAQEALYAGAWEALGEHLDNMRWSIDNDDD